MGGKSDRIVASARALVGVSFRAHGRDTAHGLDCIGLVVEVLARAGHRHLPFVPSSYHLRGGDPARLRRGMREAGLKAVRPAMPGDIVLVSPGPEQWHLMIVTPGGHVHADAGLGQVVEMPGCCPWPVLGCWRWGR